MSGVAENRQCYSDNTDGHCTVYVNREMTVALTADLRLIKYKVDWNRVPAEN